MDKQYNGWSSYETWNLALWLGNDEGSYDYWRERTREAYQQARASHSFTRREQATLDLADWLKADTEENTPTVTGFYADVLNTAISAVDWYEIAEHWIADEIEDTNEDNDDITEAPDALSETMEAPNAFTA